jgi:hypothetical protein
MADIYVLSQHQKNKKKILPENLLKLDVKIDFDQVDSKDIFFIGGDNLAQPKNPDMTVFAIHRDSNEILAVIRLRPDLWQSLGEVISELLQKTQILKNS